VSLHPCLPSSAVASFCIAFYGALGREIDSFPGAHLQRCGLYIVLVSLFIDHIPILVFGPAWVESGVALYTPLLFMQQT
jgi:hypothetical protein